MRPGDWRMTVECLASGQPRAYADHIYRYKVFFEWIPYSSNLNKVFEPVQWDEILIQHKLKSVKNWREDGDWADPKLNYIKQLGPGLWEFQVTEAYTD